MPRIPYVNLTRNDAMADRLEMSTAEIGLSVRTTNCLEERGIFTVHDLLQCTRADLLSIANFGEKTLEEVYRSLERIGFSRQGGAEVTVMTMPASDKTATA
ncbi:MAG: DNA-directed RNA polymerase subunit alpha [Planctomycetia bacterium]|nr:DNA-directed RNA polymerase subunit alpha [Planctomycetia bacterium]